MPREGRPPKLTDQACRALIREATQIPNINLKELQSSLSHTLYGKVARKKPLLKKEEEANMFGVGQKACGRLPKHMEEGTPVK